MEFSNENYNRHYIRTREDGCITYGFSDAFEQPQAGDICINEQGGYQFRLTPNGAENPAILDWADVIPLYRWDGERVAERSEEEMEAERKPIREAMARAERVAELHKLLADTDYIAAKIAEGAATREEYADMLAQRQAWRDEINAIDAESASADDSATRRGEGEKTPAEDLESAAGRETGEEADADAGESADEEDCHVVSLLAMTGKADESVDDGDCRDQSADWSRNDGTDESAGEAEA